MPIKFIQAFIFFLFFFSFQLKAETSPLLITKEFHDYKIISIDRYESKHYIQGINQTLENQYLNFYTYELDELISFELYEINNGKLKRINVSKDMIVSTFDFNSFFSGRKRYTIKINPGSSFEFKYALNEQNTLFLASFRKKGNYDAKSVNYSIQLPEELVLTARNRETYSSSMLYIDSTYFKDSIELIHFLIHPKNQDANSYYNDWFMDRINPLSKISESIVPEYLKELSKQGNKEELAKACFDYVKNQINYVAIENGINAVIPRSCDEVLNKKLGDCKDMANLTVSLLRFFNLESYHGVSRTYTLEDTLNFPSISLANHMIAVLRLNDKWIFLDATENECLFGDPSIQILGTEVLLLGNESHRYINVPDKLYYLSKTKLTYKIQKPINHSSKLTLEITCNGKMNYRFYSKLLFDKLDSVSLQSYFQDRFKLNWKLLDYSIKDTVSIIHLSIDLPSTSFSLLGNKQLLNLGFLLTPEEICHFFYLTEYPLYNSTVEYTLTTEGAVNKDFGENFLLAKDLESKIDSDKSISILLNFKGVKSYGAFKNSDLIKEWKTNLNKPLSITYEQL